MSILRFVASKICWGGPVTLLLIALSGAPTSGATCVEPIVYSGVAGPENQLASTQLQVVSLNLAREVRLEKILHDLKQAQSLADTDVWLLQEAAERPASARTIADLATSLKLNYVFVPVDFLDDGNLASGLAILSRYPILDRRAIPLTHHDLKFHTRCRIALQVTIAGPSQPVTFYNVHLDSRITLKERISQVMPVVEEASSLNVPVVVAGDFNTADVRWLWNLLPIPYAEKHSKRLRQVFRERGFASPLDGMRSTFVAPEFPLHLDWIFPRGLDSISAGVETIAFSDHNAAWVTLKMPEASTLHATTN
jgi:endonuclease/exonuclease/phosphatase family metal-dependent hydrolase